MYAYIGRQAIFDREKGVAGYELLYRSGGSGNRADIVDGDAATRGVLSDAVTIFGISHLTNGKRAFINFTRELLLGDFARLANAREIVVEVDAAVEIDGPLEKKLRELTEAGYRLALDGYSGSIRHDPILGLFDYIKVDFRRTEPSLRRSLSHRLRRSHAHLVAEKVETEADFREAMELGYHLFQGYYFEKPARLTRRVPSLAASSYGRLMNELLRPTVDYDACCQVIQSDVTLTYMLLRQVQTAEYYRGNIIDEIKQGVVMMGVDQLQRWICLVLLRQNNVFHTDELAKHAYLRGRFLQRLSKYCDDAPPAQECFILGMFSLLDQVMGVSMEELLQDLNLAPALKAALLGREENEYARFLQFVIVYEMDNDRLYFPDIGLRLSEQDVATLYEKCQAATDKAFERLGGS